MSKQCPKSKEYNRMTTWVGLRIMSVAGTRDKQSRLNSTMRRNLCNNWQTVWILLKVVVLRKQSEIPHKSTEYVVSCGKEKHDGEMKDPVQTVQKCEELVLKLHAVPPELLLAILARQ
ncbi:hypothetical protein Tco_0642511 [Tanacetum coccineum]